MNLKIKITLENKRLLRLRRYVKTKIWCNECGTETDFAAEDEIGEILKEIEMDTQLHKTLTPQGKTLICLESISKS